FVAHGRNFLKNASQSRGLNLVPVVMDGEEGRPRAAGGQQAVDKFEAIFVRVAAPPGRHGPPIESGDGRSLRVSQHPGLVPEGCAAQEPRSGGVVGIFEDSVENRRTRRLIKQREKTLKTAIRFVLWVSIKSQTR